MRTPLVVILLAVACGGHPSDEELREQLSAHRDGFESILAMLEQDAEVTRIDDSWYAPEGSLSPERLAAYRSVFRRIGVPRGVAVSSSSGHVEFLVSPLGLATGGSTKGLVYSKTPPEGPRFDTLDSRPASLSEHIKAYVPVGGHWYIFYTWDG